MMKFQSVLLNPVIWLVMSLTLGLAPFFPEPHIWEKIKWILTDASTMKVIDWVDVVLHGTPWIMLCISIVVLLKKK